MNTNVLALTMISYDGNVFGMKLATVNSLIDNYNINSLDANSSPFPNITADSWRAPPTEVFTDIKSYTFNNLNTPILITKSGHMSYLYDVRSVSTFVWNSPNNKGLSSYASVPDASIMLLLGPALIILGLFGRRRAKV